MVIDYFAVLPSGKKGALEPHCLTQGTWYQRINEGIVSGNPLWCWGYPNP